ncbi:hypothetical protein AKO1_013250 [Acrasis kona]|uniref:Peptidase S53 domain-containing protein n=1 Tax=Acrasis kona TaxID=1008807 RepID=A0AAW2YYB0_9EUKA
MESLSVLLLLLISIAVAVSTGGKARSYAIINRNPPRRTRAAPDARGVMVSGFSPAELKAAYNYNTSMAAGSGKTVGIVACYDSPSIEQELAVYSNMFGLPPCTTANGCFKKVGQTGSSTIPTAPDDEDWIGEISLDVQMVHGISPGAKILLVLAETSSSVDVLKAILYAAKNSDYVSMSLGFPEDSDSPTYENTYFKVPNVTYFCASGDYGPGVDYPTSSPNVIAVGGTSLYLSTDNIVETGWTGSGGGVSSYSSAPNIQLTDPRVRALDKTGFRKVPDLSSVGDPTTGVAVYTKGNWELMGGTSASCPIIAARAAQTGVVLTVASIYSGSIKFRDITQGYSETPSASLRYNCKVDYDFVTGLGSWVGTYIGPNNYTTSATTTSSPTTTRSGTTSATTTSSPTSTRSGTTSASPTTTTTTTNAPETTKAPWWSIFTSSSQSNRANVFLILFCAVLCLV